VEEMQLERRIAEIGNWGDACCLAADLYGTAADCEGTLAECYIAGWVNAADMIEAAGGLIEDWRSILFDATRNVHGVG
jgi:hypothetical protein